MCISNKNIYIYINTRKIHDLDLNKKFLDKHQFPVSRIK